MSDEKKTPISAVLDEAISRAEDANGKRLQVLMPFGPLLGFLKHGSVKGTYVMTAPAIDDKSRQVTGTMIYTFTADQVLCVQEFTESKIQVAAPRISLS